jgi:HEAT repeat protein
MKKVAAAALALMAAAGGLWLAWPDDAPVSPSPSRPPVPGAQTDSRPPTAAGAQEDLGETASRLLKESPKAASSLASEWRQAARENPEFLGRLIRLVLDDAAPAASRELAAFVLGTLTDRSGLEALSRALAGAKEPAWIRALLLALGCDRTSGDDDDIFDLPDTPRVLAVPLGLSVRMGGAIAESEFREVMVPHLRQSEAGVRWAAALALADSTGFPDVRAAFLDSVRAERDPATQGELGKALADWAAGQSAESADRLGIFSAILEGADRPDAASLRLRSEDGMKRMAWTSPEVRLMAGRIESGTLDQKRWAIAVLSGAAARPDVPDRSVILETFARASASTSEAKVREFAVSGLVAFPEDERARKIILGSMRDPAWHVRAAAVRALGRGGRNAEALAALQRAEREDPDERVRRAAGDVRKTLTSK